MQNSGNVFYEALAPIGYSLKPRQACSVAPRVDLNLKLFSEQSGVIDIPIDLDFCKAREIGHALLAAAEHMKPQLLNPIKTAEESKDATKGTPQDPSP